MEIKKDAQVLPRIGALREVKIFYLFRIYMEIDFPPKQFTFLLIVILSPHLNADELGVFYHR